MYSDSLKETTDDPYLGVVVIPGQNHENITANGGEVVFPQPTCTTFQQSDSGILAQVAIAFKNIEVSCILLVPYDVVPIEEISIITFYSDI